MIYVYIYIQGLDSEVPGVLKAAIRCVSDWTAKDPSLIFKYHLDRRLMYILDSISPLTEL